MIATIEHHIPEATKMVEPKATCLICGHKLTLVRPGKHQCDYCESAGLYPESAEISSVLPLKRAGACKEQNYSKPMNTNPAIENQGAAVSVDSTGGSALDRALAYSPGQDCVCFAYDRSECACSADWTPRINKIVAAWLDMSDAEMRLRCGELTAQEIRTVRAVLKQILQSDV